VSRPARAAVAFALLAAAMAGFAVSLGVASASESQTTTTTTQPPPTEPPVPPPPPVPAPIAFGVTVGGVQVGGMLPSEAGEAVRAQYTRPIPIVVSPTRRIRLAPGELGARANVPKAIRRARVARPGRIVPLDVDVSTSRIRKYVDGLARELDRKAVDAKVALRGVRPRATPAQEGRLLKRLAGSRSIRFALKQNVRTPIELRYELLKPKVASVEYRGAVVIMRSSNRLLFYNRTKLVRSFGIATGQSSYPTPLGDFEVVTMQRNPWWYPPPSDWAADSDPVPPGPGNPLGTRWMGLSAPYVGIHGTPDAASIGYSASHGCIRMRIPDAEWLFRRVEIGMPVFIVAR
jgi:L,D-transpeptidase-like protein/putative peptidoglycan binding protein